MSHKSSCEYHSDYVNALYNNISKYICKPMRIYCDTINITI